MLILFFAHDDNFFSRFNQSAVRTIWLIFLLYLFHLFIQLS